MHLSEQVGTYYVMQHKATLLSFVPTEILWEAIRDHRMDQEAKQKKLFERIQRKYGAYIGISLRKKSLLSRKGRNGAIGSTLSPPRLLPEESIEVANYI